MNISLENLYVDIGLKGLIDDHVVGLAQSLERLTAQMEAVGFYSWGWTNTCTAFALPIARPALGLDVNVKWWSLLQQEMKKWWELQANLC